MDTDDLQKSHTQNNKLLSLEAEYRTCDNAFICPDAYGITPDEYDPVALQFVKI